ncbi:MAG: methyltransferase domain-containing protein [Actinobacteria bacterium]|nr:methyltransferase domain-containing protein [Actinomycetota bacterium]MSW04944.1 methyltransferase domain-containing protein [Actinomycetota bacterium]
MTVRDRIKDELRQLPYPVKRQARRLSSWRRGRRIIAPVRWGTMRRTRPYSARWGSDRGTAIDRVYLDRFFERHSKDMHGTVLEVQEPVFSARYGADIAETAILDIEPRNMLATIVADLNDLDVLPRESFDCIVAPQTIQYLTQPVTGLKNLYESLKPGGVLLITAPFIQKIDHNGEGADRLRFSPLAFNELLETSCDGAEIEVESFGNVLTSIAFLMGISAEEMRPQDFDVFDPAYPMLVTARVRRPS